MRDEHGSRILILRTDVQEVELDAVDCSGELRVRVQQGLAAAPVVLSLPVGAEVLGCGEGTP